MLLVHEHVSVSRIALIHIYDCLVCLLKRALLDERMQLVLSSKRQHLSNISWGTNGASTQFDPLHNESKSVYLWDLIFRSADLGREVSACSQERDLATHLDELSVRSQKLKVF